jgi:hypothetical protein
MKWSTPLIVGVCIVLLGIVWYVSTPASQPQTSRTPVSTTTPATLSGTSYVEHAQYYDIAANYPSTTPLIGSANTAAVGQIDTFISTTISQFKSQGGFSTLTQADATNMGLTPDNKETLDIKYLIASSPHTVSYIFTTYEYTLGAHGNTFFQTFTFNTTTGTLLSLGDVFSGTSYLNTLSSISRAQLPGVIGQTYDPSFITDGTQPTAANFSSFFFDNSDFVILFSPYQVAPYAAGPQTLRIPTASLQSILNSQYP